MRKDRLIAGRMVMAGVVACTWTAMAMPSRQELAKAKPLVQELMNDELKAFKGRRQGAAANRAGAIPDFPLSVWSVMKAERIYGKWQKRFDLE